MAQPSQDPASLANLHDILEPPPVPWWPPAPGWYAVAALALIVASVLTWRGWRRWRANRYRRLALLELAQLQERAEDTGREAALRTLPALVKRTALAAFPRQEVAPLSGEAWLRFLSRTGETEAFTRGAGRLLEAVAYEPSATTTLQTEEISALFQAVRLWIRHHKIPKSPSMPPERIATEPC